MEAQPRCSHPHVNKTFPCYCVKVIGILISLLWQLQWFQKTSPLIPGISNHTEFFGGPAVSLLAHPEPSFHAAELELTYYWSTASVQTSPLPALGLLSWDNGEHLQLDRLGYHSLLGSLKTLFFFCPSKINTHHPTSNTETLFGKVLFGTYRIWKPPPKTGSPAFFPTGNSVDKTVLVGN